MVIFERAEGGDSSLQGKRATNSRLTKDWSSERSVRSGEADRRTLKRTTSEAMAASILQDVDPWTAWLYQPHTIMVTVAGAGLLVWASGTWQEGGHDLDSVANAKRGVWATIAVFIMYCLIQAPSTVLVRPHPVFWRFVHGIAVVYLVSLTFLLFQSRDDARQLLKHLHPDLGVGLHERSYAADCRIYTPENDNKYSNVYNTVFDEYVVAHTIGWWAKAIMIRNEPLLWGLSIAFEFCERSLIHMLANFQECWWDSFVLDVLICNWFGIWFGMKTVKYFDGKTYNWVGVSQQKSFYGKVRRTLGQFTPSYWDKDEWNALQGPWRFLQVFAMAVVILIVEIMGFFLKFILWIPPLNPLVSYRLAVWWLIANPAIREYNVYLQSSDPAKKLGAFCWLAICIATMETLVCVKFGRGLFPEPVPTYVIWFWSVVTVGLALSLGAWTYRNYQATRKISDEKTMKSKADQKSL